MMSSKPDRSVKRGIARWISILAILALFAASCGAGEDTASVDGDAGTGSGSSVQTAEELQQELDSAPAPTPLPTVDPALFATPVPTPAPDTPVDPWEVHVLTARSDTQFVPVFDGPDGNQFTLRYEYLDGSKVDYPLQNPTYFNNDLALLVVEGKPGDDWAKVQLPIRPNGTTAWVQTGFFDWSSHNYHIDINITDNWVKVYRGEELIVETPSISGKPEAPTPILEAYIDEKIVGPNAAYGPWILSIAGFSEDLNVFSQGLPKLALHGTNVPERMGEFISSGCVRVPNDIINLIADTVPVGTQVSIFT